MFLPAMNNRREIPPSGSRSSKIAIVGDFTTGFDENELKPFSGPAGTIIEQCLHAAGLIRGEVYFTNLFKSKSTHKEGHDFGSKSTTGKISLTQKGQQSAQALLDELNGVEANVIIAAGMFSFYALCGLGKLDKYRGYIFPSVGLAEQRKVIPTHHPVNAMRGMYKYRHMIVADLQKAKIESGFRELVRPERELVYNFNTVQEVLDWLEFYRLEPVVGFDIEVLNYEVSCISFSSSPNLAVSIPIADRWTLDEELLIWRGIQDVLGNPDSVKVLQNGIFDAHFLLTRNGIEVKGPIHDTMIAHSVMYPELPMGLGFLGSVYCGSQEYWKDTVKFNDIKDNS